MYFVKLRDRNNLFPIRYHGESSLTKNVSFAASAAASRNERKRKKRPPKGVPRGASREASRSFFDEDPRSH